MREVAERIIDKLDDFDIDSGCIWDLPHLLFEYDLANGEHDIQSESGNRMD